MIDHPPPSDQSTQPESVAHRDGTSQQARRQPALDPASIAIDERTKQDWLAFAREYARTLTYIGVVDNQLRPLGDWRGFLERSLDLDEIAAFWEDPNAFSPEEAAPYRRPHFLLYLTFLHLMEQVQEHLNGLTGRHLDFYYRDVLRLTRQAGLADRVHLLADLVANQTSALLPKGTRLDAGADSQGQPLIYQTERDLVVTAARVAQLRSLYRSPQTQTLYPVADATTVNVTPLVHDDAVLPYWKTFGRLPEAQPKPKEPTPSALGWAISSPLLALNQGARTITLTLGFSAAGSSDTDMAELFPGGKLTDESPCYVEVSTANGWIQAADTAVATGVYPELLPISGAQSAEAASAQPAVRFTLTLGAKMAALAAPPPGDPQIPETPWPMLRLMLRRLWQPTDANVNLGRFVSRYAALRKLTLSRVHLHVKVAGLLPTQIQNDETSMQPGKPFNPFAGRAIAGSRLYLGHPELITKRIDQIDFAIQWMGAPSDMVSHYQNYADNSGNPLVQSNGAFTTQIYLIDAHEEQPLPSPQDGFALFDPDDARKPHTISVTLPSDIGPLPETNTDGELTAWNRSLCWELNPPGFLHDLYPTLVNQKALELSLAIANQSTTAQPKEGSTENVQPLSVADYQVNPPYWPQIKSLTLGYSAASALDLEDGSVAERVPALDALYHIYPFGYAPIDLTTGYPLPGQPIPLLPQFDYEGELYIGLARVAAPETVSLLFQVADGSADPQLKPVPPQWSYLSDNQWRALDNGQILHDSTRGLINAGIVTFALPPAGPNTLLPPELYWLRAALPTDTNSVCDMVAIHAQAVTAIFIDHNNAPDHLSQPLPAQRIKGPVDPIPGVASIAQPYSSFGGKHAEQTDHFYTRIGERLRHKNRALTLWDYERLTLERFPQIYKAKCLPAQPDAPGQLQLIVIADMRGKHPLNPFEPKAPTDLLQDIHDFLVTRMPGAITLRVCNPTYVPILVRVDVGLNPEFSPGYGKVQLNEDINRFLSPWAYTEGADIVIGNRIYVTSLVNYIEERPYVDYVANLELFRTRIDSAPELAGPHGQQGTWVEAERPDEVLVAARQHTIEVVTVRTTTPDPFHGINFMEIELDFIVG